MVLEVTKSDGTAIVIERGEDDTVDDDREPRAVCASGECDLVAVVDDKMYQCLVQND